MRGMGFEPANLRESYTVNRIASSRLDKSAYGIQ